MKLVNIFSRSSMPAFNNKSGQLLKVIVSTGQIKSAIGNGYRVEEILTNGSIIALDYYNYDKDNYTSIPNRDLLSALTLEYNVLPLAEYTKNTQDIFIQTISCAENLLQELVITEYQIQNMINLLNTAKEQLALKGDATELIKLIKALDKDINTNKYSDKVNTLITTIKDSNNALISNINILQATYDEAVETSKSLISNLLTKSTENSLISVINELRGYDNTKLLLEAEELLEKSTNETAYLNMIYNITEFIRFTNLGDPTVLNSLLLDISKMTLGTTKLEKNLKNKVKEAEKVLATTSYTQANLDKLVNELNTLINDINKANEVK